MTFKEATDLLCSSATALAEMDQVYKDNMLNLVKYHREHCDGNCGVSLRQVLSVMLRAGLVVTEEERKLFT